MTAPDTHNATVNVARMNIALMENESPLVFPISVTAGEEVSTRRDAHKSDDGEDAQDGEYGDKYLYDRSETGVLCVLVSKHTAVRGFLTKNCWYFCSPGRI